jgi:hypothetical protein
VGAARKRKALALLILATKKAKEKNKNLRFFGFRRLSCYNGTNFRVTMARTAKQTLQRASHPSSTTGHH